VSIEDLLVHREWVHRVARSLAVDESGADDLAQETWLRHHASPPRHGGALKAWLGTVVRRAASDARRSR
jgi:DNA-directed RNA polymerase specialized sigma24 family protein